MKCIIIKKEKKYPENNADCIVLLNAVGMGGVDTCT